MKKIILLCVGLIFLALPSEAQSKNKGFNRISAGYDIMYLSHLRGLKGVNLQYIHGFSITKLPLYIETGVGVSYNNRNFKPEYWIGDNYPVKTYDRHLGSYSAIIPINLSYRINLQNNFSVQPYTGFNFRVNPALEGFEATQSIISELEYGKWDEYKPENKIFQFGWQIGLGFNISKLYIGVQYGLDFIPRAIMKCKTTEYDIFTAGSRVLDYSSSNVNSSSLLLRVGFNF